MIKNINLLIMSIVAAIYATTVAAQPFLQTPTGAPPPSGKILSPTEFSNQATQMNQRNQMKYQQQLEQSLSKIPQPSTAPSQGQGTSSTSQGTQGIIGPNELPATTTTPSTNAAASTPQTAAPSTTTPPPVVYQPPRQTQQSVYTGFQGGQQQQQQGGNQQQSGGWNIKY